MTEHDQDASIGNLTKRYSDAKRQRVALLVELDKHGMAIEEFGKHLRSLKGYSAVGGAPLKVPLKYPATDTIASLLSDYQSIAEEIEKHTNY